ncbi:MAG: DNA primase, partial [Candidatus Dependentiae bacterium]|nr:DNA primase [Candidatus Dependentiae bacterium]
MNIFTFIKSRVPILDVIGSYTALKKAGHYWKSPCPFHSEKTGSFTVSPHKDIFYCFGCHASGDVISFIAKIENCSPLEAARFLAERYNIELPESLNHEESGHDQEEKKRYYDLCEIVARWCHEQLLKSPSAMQYLKKRLINQQSISYFTIGYFPGGLQASKQFIHDMGKQNILIDSLVTANILMQGKNIFYSPFEERIMFPIKDHLGRFCGFGGRIFKEQDARPKYYNSHENEYFLKGSLLFGLDLAKKEIQKKETVFLVEGYTDCVAMVQHGYANTVATLGTACTIDHLKLLSRHADQLYVLYDGDAAGQQAILRLASLCWQATIDLRVVVLPNGEDPASFLGKQGDLNALVSQSKDILLFFIESLGKNFREKGLSAKLSITRKIIEALQPLDDQLKKDILLKKAADLLEIPFESLRQEEGKVGKHAAQVHQAEEGKKVEENIVPALEVGACKLEKKIFFAIMNNIQLFSKENGWYLLTFLPRPLRDILQLLD